MSSKENTTVVKDKLETKHFVNTQIKENKTLFI